MATESEPPVVGGTYEWHPTLLKDGVPYTPDSATIYFQAPNSVLSVGFAMTVGSGEATYQNTTSLFTVEGTWHRSVKTAKSGVVLESKKIAFTVYASLAALAS